MGMPTPTDPYEEVVWDIRYIDAPICRFRDGDLDGAYDKTAAGVDDNLYFVQDALFCVTALVDPASGSVVERYVYTPYGQPTIYTADWSATLAWPSSRKNEILFCGYRYDPEAGMYHVRNRMLHPALGNWAQRDPEGYVDGLHVSAYVTSAPTNANDAFGLEKKRTGGYRNPIAGEPPYDDCGCDTEILTVSLCYVIWFEGTSMSFRFEEVANNILHQCCVRFAKHKQWSVHEADTRKALGDDLQLYTHVKEFAETRGKKRRLTAEERALLWKHTDPNCDIIVHFVKGLTGTHKAQSYPWSVWRAEKLQPSVAIGAAGYWVLAHEIGHVLLNSPDEGKIETNLMAGGRAENKCSPSTGCLLTAQQCERIRANIKTGSFRPPRPEPPSTQPESRPTPNARR